MKRCPRCHIMAAMRMGNQYWVCTACKYSWRLKPLMHQRPTEHHQFERLRSIERRDQRKGIR